MKTDVIVHVGYGKTATTWLQEKIFNAMGEDIYLGKRESSFPDWLLKINYLDDFAYHQQREILRKKIMEILAGRKRVIISSEAFTNFGVVYDQIGRIDYFFEQPRIILVLRHPIDWLISNYKYCVEHEGFSLPLESYIDFGENRTPFALEKRRPFYIPDLFYDEVGTLYRQVFGPENVLILRYEDFVSQTNAFGESISNFIGIGLPNFEEKAKQRVLASKTEKDVGKRRITNMMQYINNAGFETTRLVSKRLWEEILSADTHERLRRLFSSHCSQYYPELVR